MLSISFLFFAALYFFVSGWKNRENRKIAEPLKIWNISYPSSLKVPEYYYEDILPNPKVTSLEGRY